MTEMTAYYAMPPVIRRIEHGVYNVITNYDTHHELKILGSDVPMPTTMTSDAKWYCIDPNLWAWEIAVIFQKLLANDIVKIPDIDKTDDGALWEPEILPGTYVVSRVWISSIEGDPDCPKDVFEGYIKRRLEWVDTSVPQP